MKKVCLLAALILILSSTGGATPRRVSLEAGFNDPSDEYRPWCYWFWMNGNTDRETMEKDLVSMRDLGFRGLLLLDPRGYWDDDTHVTMPAPESEFMSGQWLDNVCYAIRKADSLGIRFTMNLSSCGGSLKGPWDLGEDCPKRLMFKDTPLDGGTRLSLSLDTPGDMPFFKDVALFAIRHDGTRTCGDGWRMSGDGFFDMSPRRRAMTEGTKADMKVTKALETVELTGLVSDSRIEWDVPEGNWTLVRFASTTIPGFEKDVDVLDPEAVERHIRRIVEPIREKVPGLVGKTLTHLYSVSWEGAVPTWSPGFERDFLKFTGMDLRPLMPMLAGFETGEGIRYDAFMQRYRKARNDMFRENFYGTMRALCSEYGVGMYSECGGPWVRDPEVFREADQQEFLSLNDMPQGEFWCRDFRVAHNRGAASTAHMYGLKRASAEAFTHMSYHWSMYPDTLKYYGDQAFLDGINHFVWHTFTSSPDRFGVPGGEYFAGTHINRNVTWYDDAAPFVTYLSRCQYMLQQGLPVVDIAVWAGDRVYQHWGHYRDIPYDGAKFRIPEGYNCDVMTTEVLLKRARAEKGRLTLPDGMSYSVLVLDPWSEDCMTEEVAEKIEALGKAGVRVLTARDKFEAGVLPDFEGGFEAFHRKVGRTDIWFVAGEGSRDMVFRASGDVQLWDAVTGKRWKAESERLSDGRTRVRVDLERRGSVFVVFNAGSRAPRPARKTGRTPVPGPWEVSFRYHRLPSAKAPSERIWESPGNLAGDRDREVSHFSGTVTMKTTFTSPAPSRKASYSLSLGRVTGGLAHVWLNGIDCGTVWTAPWSADITTALREGENELRVEFTNTWRNLLTADCARAPEERLTRSVLHYREGRRKLVRGKGLVPTMFSGYMSEDKLQDNGVLGPVEIIRSEYQ